MRVYFSPIPFRVTSRTMRELISERTLEGMARARAEGKPIGKRRPDRKPRRRRSAA